MTHDELNRLAIMLDYLSGIVDREVAKLGPVVVVPDPEQPKSDTGIARKIEQVKVQGTSVHIKFGFTTNRPGRLQYRKIGSELSYLTLPESSFDWGGVGREHSQWLHGLEVGQPYTVDAMTLAEDGKTWVIVKGMRITVTIKPTIDTVVVPK